MASRQAGKTPAKSKPTKPTRTAAPKKAVGSATPAKRKPGRPSSFTKALGNVICGFIASGESIRSICAKPKMPSHTTLLNWLANPEHAEFLSQYARAREAQADKLAEEILQIADDGRNDTYRDDKGEHTDTDVIARSKLRVDARKWLASKLAPKKYADKLGIGGAEELGPVETAPRDMTNAEIAVRLSRFINGNPAALAAILAMKAKS